MLFWVKLSLSLMGRVAVAKMLILPGKLYYFAALQTKLSATFFKDIHSVLAGLIWG